jgi:hypothetical protein
VVDKGTEESEVVTVIVSMEVYSEIGKGRMGTFEMQALMIRILIANVTSTICFLLR